MARLFLLGLAILFVGLLFVVLPVVAHTYGRLKSSKSVRCPRDGLQAVVEIDAAHAAVTSAVGPADLRVASCSRWPRHRGCGEECVRQIS